MSLEALNYSHGEVALTGWLARPQGTPRAAVVIMPTIANSNAAMERRAQMFADLGYIAMIADFYGEQVPSFEASRPLADKLRADVTHYRGRIAAAISALRACPETTNLPFLAVGYCMGGQAVLEAARDGQDLQGVVSFHGILSTAKLAEINTVKARILVCHGDGDPMVPRSQVMAFWEEMDAAQANWHFHAYSGVKHGFTDIGSDARGLPAIAYNASADRQSWTAMLAFFDEILGSD